LPSSAAQGLASDGRQNPTSRLSFQMFLTARHRGVHDREHPSGALETHAVRP
jgi:hypothetical protein